MVPTVARPSRLLAVVGVLLPMVGVALPIVAYGGGFSDSGLFRQVTAYAAFPALAAAYGLWSIRRRWAWTPVAVGAAAGWVWFALALLDTGPIIWDGPRGGGAVFPQPSWGSLALVAGLLLVVAAVVLAWLRPPPRVARARGDQVARAARVVVGGLAVLGALVSIVPVKTDARGEVESAWTSSSFGPMAGVLALGVVALVVVVAFVPRRVPLVMLCLVTAAPFAMLVHLGMENLWQAPPGSREQPDPVGVGAALTCCLGLVAAAGWLVWGARTGDDSSGAVPTS